MKSATRSKMKYNEHNYDRLYITVKKGNKETYELFAKKAGFSSLNSFVEAAINEAIIKYMKESQRIAYKQAKDSRRSAIPQSDVVGVSWNSSSQKWRARMTIPFGPLRGKKKDIGYFKLEEDAISALYNEKEKYRDGKF